MSVSLIFARARNRVIGRDGQLPWDLPADFDFFNEQTRGQAIIIGRRTYFDQPEPFRDRQTIVVTSNSSLAVAPTVKLAGSLAAALTLVKPGRQAYIAGGTALFVSGLPLAQRVFETVVDADVSGDTRLPPLDLGGWRSRLVKTQDIDDQHAHAFSIYCHERPEHPATG